MPRAEAFDAFYRESRARLLHQTYAFVCDIEVAQRSVAEAYVAAGQHWRKVAQLDDRDAWMRERAFRATGRAENRGRLPWYTRALKTSDDNRPLLAALWRLPADDRHLVILRYLAGIDPSAAAREAGMTDDEAARSHDHSLAILVDAGVATDGTDLADRLQRLRGDLTDAPADRPGRLRREGNRRRRSRLLLGAVCAVALAIGTGALTVAQPLEDAAPRPSEPRPSARPDAKPPEEVAAADLAGVRDARALDPDRRWRAVGNTRDKKLPKRYDECLTRLPRTRPAEHAWLNRFEARGAPSPTRAAQLVEVGPTAAHAETAYQSLVYSYSLCAGRQLAEFSLLQGVGDGARLITLRSVVRGEARTRQVAVARTGTAVTAWVVDAADAHQVRRRALTSVLADSVDELCKAADGACTERPYAVVRHPPPPVGTPAGFLATIDLPVLDGIDEPWAGTKPGRVRHNPAATDCDQADFAAAGATEVRARTFVVPGAKGLGGLFGVSQTIGRFDDLRAAARFERRVGRTVERCEDRQSSASVTPIDRFTGSSRLAGSVWGVELTTAEHRTVEFQVALVRVGDLVTQITFTPAGDHDLSPRQFLDLAVRAGQRLAQA